MADAVDFDGLRRQGIAVAQALSGETWTDYNLHDPGVTLLEQICYALTELAYRSDFPVTDLLTDPDGALDHARLGLNLPREVLLSRPVTVHDLALVLSDSDPAVERVLVDARAGNETGLYDLFVVPDAAAEPAMALDAVRRAFHANRNLCEDIRALELASPVRCVLEARIEIRRRHPPERVAALIYDRCRRLMRDRRAGCRLRPATRGDVFADPSRAYGHLADPQGGAVTIDAFFAELSRLDEVEDIVALSCRRQDDRSRDAFSDIERGQYRELVVPADPGDVGLVLVSRDLETPFDLARMHRELARLRADQIAGFGEALDAKDWEAPPPGRRRDFAHLPLGHTLPPAYRAVADRSARSGSEPGHGETGRLQGYLAIADAVLANASADLANLFDLMSADAGSGQSYASRPLGGTAISEAPIAGPDSLSRAVQASDPWHDRKARVLEHLLGLQGEEFSQNSLRQHDLYRGCLGGRNAVLENRARLLGGLPVLNGTRAAAADMTSQEGSQTAGLGRKLTILLDFPDRDTARLSDAVPRAGLELVPGAGAEGDWRIPRDALATGDDPFAMLVPRVELLPPADREGLFAATAFLEGRTVGGEALRRGVSIDAYMLVAESLSEWRLVLDPGPAEFVLDIGRFSDRTEAVAQANRLRAFFVELNRGSEGFYLVEDVLLRGTDSGYAPLTLTAVFAGWSARCLAPGFRRLAEETLALLCPAHLSHQVIWLDHRPMAEFEALESAWRDAFRDARDSGVMVSDELGRRGAELRSYLSAAVDG